MFFTEKYEKLNMATNIAENTASVIGASVGFSIFQLFFERD